MSFIRYSFIFLFLCVTCCVFQPSEQSKLPNLNKVKDVRQVRSLAEVNVDVKPVIDALKSGGQEAPAADAPTTTSKPLFHASILRKRRGLLDVKLDLDPVLGGVLRGKATPAPPTITSTVTASTIAAPAISCGRKLIQHTQLITNGLTTNPGDWPWHAALYRLKTSGSQQQYICGGTLLSPTRVLTAGHCVMENNRIISPERLFVVLGKYNLAGGDIASEEKGVFDIIVHPEFSATSLVNDIAILKLSSRVIYSDYIQPVCLWDRLNLPKSNVIDRIGTVVGWGFNEHDTLATQLTKVNMPIKADLDCIKTNPLFFSKFVSELTFCAGFRNGTSVCNGDSGGGMFFSKRLSDGQEVWSIRGIVSLSIPRRDRNICDPNEYTIFTDSAQYLSFIEENL